MPPGPTLIFDKSALEALNPDEANWLDHFFLCNITPLFFIEVLADLEKQMKEGRTPEEVVGSLARKTPDMNSAPNVHHLTLLAAELGGAEQIDMRFGRPIVPGGKTVSLGDQAGILLQSSPEEEACQRWTKGEFLEVERRMARSWRETLAGLDFEVIYNKFQGLAKKGGKPRTLEDVKARVNEFISETDPEKMMRIGLSLPGHPAAVVDKMVARWEATGRQPLADFAPYFMHVLSVDLLFNVGIASDLISRDRPTNKVDLAYLYYLPFCTVFVSNDKLHERTVPCLLKAHQMFIKGSALKTELGKLDAHYWALPEGTKAQGLYAFASYPPENDSFLVTQLWDRYLPKWRENKANEKPHDPKTLEAIKALTDKLKDAKHDPTRSVSFEEAAYVTQEKQVRRAQGKWIRFPETCRDKKDG